MKLNRLICKFQHVKSVNHFLHIHLISHSNFQKDKLDRYEF